MINMFMSEDDCRRAVYLGTKRNNIKTSDLDRGKWTHPLGVLSEIGISNLTGVPVDESIHKGGDNTDLNDVEIKTGTFPINNLDLKVKMSEFNLKKPRAYILCWASKNVFDLKDHLVIVVGYILYKDFCVKKNFKNYGRYNDWAVHCNDLVDATTENIINLLNNKESPPIIAKIDTILLNRLQTLCEGSIYQCNPTFSAVTLKTPKATFDVVSDVSLVKADYYILANDLEKIVEGFPNTMNDSNLLREKP